MFIFESYPYFLFKLRGRISLASFILNNNDLF